MGPEAPNGGAERMQHVFERASKTGAVYKTVFDTTSNRKWCEPELDQTGTRANQNRGCVLRAPIPYGPCQNEFIFVASGANLPHGRRFETNLGGHLNDVVYLNSQILCGP